MGKFSARAKGLKASTPHAARCAALRSSASATPVYRGWGKESPPAVQHFMPASRPHTCVAFLLPGISVHLTALRPEVLALQGDTLGLKLRRRRRELALDRRASAELMSIDQKTLMWWERDERPPFVRAYPAIIRFLGYEPWNEPLTLGEALLAQRRRRGLRTGTAARVIGVDEGTLRRWERGEWNPTSVTLDAIDRWLGCDARRAFPSDVRWRGRRGGPPPSCEVGRPGAQDRRELRRRSSRVPVCRAVNPGAAVARER